METTETLRVTRAVSAQDWKDIEQRLKGFYDSVKLICDGYELTLVLQRIGQFRNAIAVYIDGKIDGKWMIEDCEQRRRFYCPKSKSFYSKKDMADFKKISKRIFKEMQAKNKYVYYEPYWTSFRSLKNHLIKNNKSIELVVA
ncbi:hypothetical protein [Brevibacillus agri]|uniref:hypothetical protein n=1 Tax=Brevibacillus agri TaxID=51101 RepID=UPI0018CDA3E3|nr:hypothetical protein [Brevibacillus agri]MBG9567457.1 hypothetical protein [Brevibacillus agri]MBY0054774.1 hypothetical protein [Brevibacillus agri]